ncbi:hypothetical protein BC826DRAFT_170998 [Russula brevipes]|nr:hypothetical protein BC826DRAFT_170998 [Russula brevipes]
MFLLFWFRRRMESLMLICRLHTSRVGVMGKQFRWVGIQRVQPNTDRLSILLALLLGTRNGRDACPRKSFFGIKCTISAGAVNGHRSGSSRLILTRAVA